MGQEVSPRAFPDPETYEVYLDSMNERVMELTEKKNLIQENIFQLNCEEKMIMREMKEVMEEMGVERGKRKGGLGKDKLAFDELEKERRKKEEQAIYDARLKKLQDERKALQNAQEEYRNAHQEQNFDEIDDDGVPTVIPKKLDTKLSMF